MGNRTDPEEIVRITAMQDPVLRNEEITRSYSALSQSMLARTGPCANWCTFATWASKQAGQTIREEDLGNALKQRLEAIPEWEDALEGILQGAVAKGSNSGRWHLVGAIWQILDPAAVAHRAADAVARGNRKVYAEIALEFARFIQTFAEDSVWDSEKIDRFCRSLRPGDPPEGQQYLRQAFARYYEAFFESDEKKKAERMLWANIEIGFHEQTRLQPEIREAMEAAVLDDRDFKEKLLRVLFPGQHWLLRIGPVFTHWFQRPTPLDLAIQRLTATARHHIRRFLSAHLMELRLSTGEVLHLGKDLNRRFPPHLMQIAHPGLIHFLRQIDPTPDSLRDTAAVDWANLSDRLHFIADLFRCYQESPALLELPPD